MIKNIIKQDNENNSPSIFYYLPNFLNKQEQKELFDYLESTKNFIPTPKFKNGITRLQKWYQKDMKYFCSEWDKRYPQWESFEIDDKVSKLLTSIQKYIDEYKELKEIRGFNVPDINSCLINKYQTGEHYISPHKDCSISFGEEPTIIGLSIGVTRTIDFIPNIPEKNNKQFSFELESGSIFIMAGSSQKFYKHSIRRCEIIKDVRYSLTFREYIS
jgi:alkylated DNA repair dioxygenase AlkB